ncbi:MAG: Era-like GTP-binding protein [Candidatus Nanoarchaeia archaeon]|nr:Era-like GTP-binding protein [Candidatus Nanoarchaeia archaeon]
MINITFLGNFIGRLKRFFKKKKNVKIGLYGPPNGGKTTLANRICLDWLGEEMGAVSEVEHETRQIQIKEEVQIQAKGKSVTFNLVDTPGIATKVDFEDFLKAGMDEETAKTRAKEATKGIIESIKWIENMDVVLVVLDATKNPYSQVNITIVGNLAARNIPVIIVANKVDLKDADIKKVEEAFPQYKVVGISAKFGTYIQDFYDLIVDSVR